MILARGPCCSSFVSLLLLPGGSVRAQCASVSNVFALSAHACVSTHLLPLPETVVVLVEPLPRGNVVLAVKTREVGHAVLCVSGCARGLSGHAGGRGSGAEVHGGLGATYATRRAIVGRILAESGVV